MDEKIILIVDDEEEIRISLSRYLKKHSFKILTATNGNEAAQLITNEKIDLVVSDIRMPIMDGIKLLTFIKNRDKNIPVILITGFSEILETKDAYELGANGFLSKPFRLKDLLNTISSCLGNKQIEPQTKDNFRGINIEEFISGSKIDYPIFIMLSDIKFVKISDNGEDIDQARINKYKEKGVNKLYLLKEDHKKYIDVIKKITTGLSEKKISMEENKKIEFLKIVNKIIAEQVYCEQMDRHLFRDAKDILNTTFSILYENDKILKLILSLSKSSDELYAHSVAVSMLSVMLTKKLGWILEKNRNNIAMSALFHDFGKKNLNPELIKKKFVDLSYEEKVELEKHPSIGANMLMEFGSMPSEVIDVALQHHENCQGTGYPNKLSKLRINPLAKIISIANEFMNLVENLNDTPEEVDKFRLAFKRLVILKYQSFESDHFKAFASIFSFGQSILREQGYE